MRTLHCHHLGTALVGGTLVAVTIALAGVPATFAAGAIRYPETKRVDQVDTYHGVEVADPYRWLEDDVRESNEVRAWVAAENQVTNRYLASLPERTRIRERLTELWNYEKFTTPFKAGGRYYYRKNDGLQNQFVLYVMDRLDAEPRILLDPNAWSKEGTAALDATSFSDDGKYLAYSIAKSGSDWQTWRVMEIDSGRVLDDEVQWVKFSTAAWTRDSAGFFYSRFDAPKPGVEFQSLNLNQKLYYHRVATSQEADVLVHADPAHPEWGFGAEVSEDGRYLVIGVWKGTDDKNRLLYRDLTEPYAMPIALIDHFEDEYSFIGNDGPVFYFKTDRKAARGRIVAIDIRKPAEANWRELVAERPQPLRSAALTGNMFIASYLEDAKSRVVMFDIDGQVVREVDFPGIGTAEGFAGRRADTETFYSFSSFATPPSIYRHDLLTGKTTPVRQAKVDFRPDDFEVKQVFYKSLDGTRVPMFIAHKKGLTHDGTNPTLLYGYGGFNIAIQPSFSVANLAWMELGGIYAVANLRGGGEYGEDWHQAGTRVRKQNVFNDFIAAAEWLVSERYTSQSKLAIHGRSNGGLLIGAVMTQRPDLAAAAIPGVGVMDMLRFHKFTAGRYWVDDYGSADDPDEFKALLTYSPYHNLRPDVAYPATMVTTADTDDRVVPGHSFKFAAALQKAQAGPKPVLIRIETEAGHGAGTPTSKLIELVSDQWAFLAKELGMTLPQRPRTPAKPLPTDRYP